MMLVLWRGRLRILGLRLLMGLWGVLGLLELFVIGRGREVTEQVWK